MKRINSKMLKRSDPNIRRRLAVHEAGHAVLTAYFGFPLAYVTIESDGNLAGASGGRIAPEINTQHPDGLFALEKEIIVLMAGVEAEKSVLPRIARPPWGDVFDKHDIGIRTRELCTFTHEQENSAKRRLRHHASWYVADPAIKGAIIDFANELLANVTIREPRLKRLLKQALDKHHRNYYPERFQ